MIYVKSFLTGLAALIAAGFLAVVVLILKVQTMSSGAGIGAIAGPGWLALVVAFLAFSAGFFWQYLRLSRKG